MERLAHDGEPFTAVAALLGLLDDERARSACVAGDQLAAQDGVGDG